MKCESSSAFSVRGLTHLFNDLEKGQNMANTMPPTTTARNTIMMGSSMEVMAPTALSTSSSYTSATLRSMSGSWPVSSPTSTMEITMGGKSLEEDMGVTTDSPSFTES